MTAKQLREKFIKYFSDRGHTAISSASLLPENDATVLFTTAGMQPLVPYLLGERHPGGKRLVGAQKCIRTSDIEEIGDKTHHTFFEMLGNWSLGDYFKKEAIDYSFEFLTSPDYLNLDPKRLAVSVFAGDDNAPFDEESYQIWQEIFKAHNLPLTRLIKLPKEHNWWGPAGETGPCGPDTEIFYWPLVAGSVPEQFDADDDTWVEIWNNVFMEYNKDKAGNYSLLAQKNVDTGMGLERLEAVINEVDDNYLTASFLPLIKELEKLSGLSYASSAQATKAMRIIADHIKAATFIIGDEKGVSPSNTDQGYIVRRLLRRALRYGLSLNIKKELWLADLAKLVIADYEDFYPELRQNESVVIEAISTEEHKFRQTLERGLVEFNKIKQSDISGVEAFKLYQSYGFPLEITIDLATEAGVKVDKEGFDEELKKHQALSRTAAAGKFKGGLADNSEATTRLHTAAHLLLAALRKVLGDGVEQRGSNITAERLRFDFSYGEKMTPEQIKQVEDLVNQAITAKLPVTQTELSLSEARERGAIGVFDSKYEEKVKVYTVAPVVNGVVDYSQAFSQEICGGPHVENTAQLSHFRISKEGSSSAGVRRIKAVLGE